MRYEFERDGAVVATVLWEGPGQVTVEGTDARTQRDFESFFGSEVTYLSAGFVDGQDDSLAVRRRDWTPWEFERSCRSLAHRMHAGVRRVQTGPVEDRPGERVWAR